MNLGVQSTPGEAIRRLIALYAFKLDDREYAALAELLDEQCVMAVGTFRLHGRAEILESVTSMQTQEPGRHLIGPTVVEFEDDSHASAWTDMVGVIPGPTNTHVIAGTWRYHDRIVLHEGSWVFTHRYLHAPTEPLIQGAPPLPDR